jgi:hypothetical protein
MGVGFAAMKHMGFYTICSGLLVLSVAVSCAQAGDMSHEMSDSRITDQVITPNPASLPARPKPVVEIGDPFLGVGPLSKGFTLPTGAVWQPSFLVFGTYRSALQAIDRGGRTFSEWANRLDLFGNVYLTPTERIVVGLRPLDQGPTFSGYYFEPKTDDGWQDGTNSSITTLFFEGDFGELFPRLDPKDSDVLDIGFSVGRQPISFQNGILINDSIDAVGITRNSLRLPGAPNMRMTALYGWNEVHRSNNLKSDSAKVYGLFTEADYPGTTISLDLAYVKDEESKDAFFSAVSAIQRIHHINTALRLLNSHASQASAAADSGTLYLAEISWTPTHTDNLIYVNGFYADKLFSSAARGPGTGGPLGPVGILFASPGIGRYGSALSNEAHEAYGGSFGYQTFLGGLYSRRQLIVELGGRKDTNGTRQGATAIGARYQQALGRQVVFQLDGFAASYEEQDNNYGLRSEVLLKF